MEPQRFRLARVDPDQISFFTLRRRIEERRKESGGLGMKIGEGMLSPMRAKISGITVEYGLYEGRFWLPKMNVAEGEAQAGFVRMPVKFEESFKYDAVNGTPLDDSQDAKPAEDAEDAAQASAATARMLAAFMFSSSFSWNL